MGAVFLQLRRLSDGRVRASAILAGWGIAHQGGSLDGDDQVSSRYDRLPPFIGPVLGGVDDARRTLDVGGLGLDDHESVVGALRPAVLSIAEIQVAGCAVPVGWSREWFAVERARRPVCARHRCLSPGGVLRLIGPAELSDGRSARTGDQ